MATENKPDAQLSVQLVGSSYELLEDIPLISYLERTPLAPGLTPFTHHPYTDYAVPHVKLPADRIDWLFKSRYFKCAAEPLFDINHVDSDFRMDAVFPGCLEDPTFLNALLCSVIVAANRGRSSIESLRLHSFVLMSLMQSISVSQECLDHAKLGAIMILQGLAYRWYDRTAHAAHTQALVRLMHGPKDQASRLTALGARALFWQDLFAALLVNSQRHVSHGLLPAIQWQREQNFGTVSSLPMGFIEHQAVLPIGLLNCIEDIVELQSTVCDMKSKTLLDQHAISNMQASIESRLAAGQEACQRAGVIAECCRVAALLLCVLSFTETWENALVPSRLSDMLRKLLDASFSDSVWLRRRNLQIWMLLIGCSVAVMEKGYVDNLVKNWKDLLVRYRDHQATITPTEQDRISVESVFNDFIYCKRLVRQRWMVEGWSELEVFLRASRESPQ